VKLNKVSNQVVNKPVIPAISVGLKGVTVLCIDNDPDVLNGMIELLNAWQCTVLSADSFTGAMAIFADHKDEIEIMLVDYQLSKDEDGLTLIGQLRASCQQDVPAILITATTDIDIESKAKEADVGFMKKLVKPASLRAMMSAMLAKKLTANYLD
jgi:CheY-like chemotaxis protein